MKNLGAAIIANAIIWGAVILGTAFKLKGTGLASDVTPILAGGAVVSNILLGGLLGKRKT
ncbi:MAG: hypothetical protein ABIJ00_03905 [Candidatus Eisenbacteria bacterium]